MSFLLKEGVKGSGIRYVNSDGLGFPLKLILVSNKNQSINYKKMVNARSVVDVMVKLLKIIPDEEVGLRDEITKYNETLWNQSPEALKTEYCWMPLQLIVNRNVKEIDNEWKKELLRIFNDV